jgi:hypothetical protein
VENCCGKLLRKTQAGNSGRKFLLKILAENCCGKFRPKIYAENLAGHTEFMHLVKSQSYDGTMADDGISALRKISAPSQNLSGKLWRPLTIWARQNLPLLTSSWSG